MKRLGGLVGILFVSVAFVGCGGTDASEGGLVTGPELDKSTLPPEVRKFEEEQEAIVAKARAAAEARAAKKAKSAKTANR